MIESRLFHGVCALMLMMAKNIAETPLHLWVWLQWLITWVHGTRRGCCGLLVRVTRSCYMPAEL